MSHTTTFHPSPLVHIYHVGDHIAYVVTVVLALCLQHCLRILPENGHLPSPHHLHHALLARSLESILCSNPCSTTSKRSVELYQVEATSHLDESRAFIMLLRVILASLPLIHLGTSQVLGVNINGLPTCAVSRAFDWSRSSSIYLQISKL